MEYHRKTQRFAFSLSPLEKEAASRLADGESVAALVRRLIRAEAQRHGLWPATRGRDEEGGDEHNH